MNGDLDHQLDQLLDAACAPQPADWDRRLAGAVPSPLPAVRPLPARATLIAGLSAMTVLVALAAAGVAGWHGWAAMSRWDRAAIFPLLLLLMALAASGLVREVIPGSPRRLQPGLRLTLVCATLLALFALLFRQYATDHFLVQGLACLRAGLLVAIPAAALGWLLLRRACALSPALTGLAAGAWAGLAGVAMLELHCPNLQAPHVLVWHVAVVPVAAGLGLLIASLVRPRT